MLEMYSIREKGSNNNYLQLFICIKMVKKVYILRDQTKAIFTTK